MKYIKYILIVFCTSMLSNPLRAQDQSSVSIAKSLDLYVFPNEGQDQATQSNDEGYCYKWAVEQTGYDPINPTQVQAEQVDRSADGSMVRGGARGAAAGAAIGAIAGDAGKGAAIGAVAGGLRGRRAKKVGDEIEQQQNVAEANVSEQAMLDDYKKAFMVCMEAKGYTIK